MEGAEGVVGCTFRDPLIHAGFVIFARRGMMLAVCIREPQLSGVLDNVRSDMCGGRRALKMVQLCSNRRQEPRVSAIELVKTPRG